MWCYKNKTAPMNKMQLLLKRFIFLTFTDLLNYSRTTHILTLPVTSG
jgi:hypothetical protein